MRVLINGEERIIADRLSVADLLQTLSIKGDRVAVEINVEVVRRDARASRMIAEGDVIEIVSFVGGG